MSNITPLKDKVSKLPDAPGVYVFKNAKDAIIYIGKAKSLKRRVYSYFSKHLDSKTQALVSRIADLEYLTAPTESQAQILEAKLIKEKQPPYNIDLKDDKSFPYIKITKEKYPIVSVCRIKKTDKPQDCLYFGPYTNAKFLRQAFKVIRRVFGFRSCKNMPDEACLYHRIKLCPAPCIRKVTQAQYAQIMLDIGMFLESRYEELVDKLSRRMSQAAAERDFEEAARIRDQISALAVFGQHKMPVALDELSDLKSLLRLVKLPERIEAFDISNISGTNATGSMVSFYRAFPDKNNYRRFRIKTVAQINDYKMLAEVVQRRYSRLLRENLPLPDLILVDGGRGHLDVAAGEIEKLGLKIPLASIAKERENIHVYGKALPLRLKQDTPALNLIRRIRDEAHRFAISYHRLLRRKKTIGR